MSEEIIKEFEKSLRDIKTINKITVNSNTFDYLIAKITGKITVDITGVSTCYEIKIEIDNSLKDGDIKYE